MSGQEYLKAMEWAGSAQADDEHEGRVSIPACPVCGTPSPEVQLVDEEGEPLPPYPHDTGCIYYFDLCARCGGTKGLHVGWCAGLED